MKQLLSQTLRAFSLYALIVLAASVPVYYYLVDRIWLSELDEHNEIIAARIGKELVNLEATDVDECLHWWNRLQPGTNLKKSKKTLVTTDCTYTVLRGDRFRGLRKIIPADGYDYRLTVETNVEETEETVGAIALVTFLFFLILVVGFLLLNSLLSDRLWQPFRKTLSQLKAFDLSTPISPEFESSNILEFEEMNDALRKLIANNISAYRIQKEFTENASHELQTPLAIIQNKLDLLLQTERLSDRQYQLIEAANGALKRMTRINKNLLLLAKIENHQFDDREIVNMSLLTRQSFERLKEYFENKEIMVELNIDDEVFLEGNRTLMEILLDNLLLNTIRHNQPRGGAMIVLVSNHLSVSNSGESTLDPSILFNRFTRLSKEHAGSGLGLSIIHEISQRHHWQFQYEFRAGYHTFILTFDNRIKNNTTN